MIFKGLVNKKAYYDYFEYNFEDLDEEEEKVLDKMMADYDICIHVADKIYEEVYQN